MKTTLIQIIVNFKKTSGRACRPADLYKVDNLLLCDSIELSHGDSYEVNSTTWRAPELFDGSVEVEFSVEVQPCEGESMTEEELVDEVHSSLGCFCHESYEVKSLLVSLA